MNFMSIAFVLVCALCFSTPASAIPFPLGLWVEVEGPNRTLDSLDRLEAMLQAAKEMGVEHLFIQVYRGNRAWYPSKLADDGPFQAILRRDGQDPLAFVLRKAHERGMKVHAWVNLFNLARNREALVIRRLGRDAILTDTLGRSLLDYQDLQPGDGLALDTPGYWLDPANPTVQAYLIEVMIELVSHYPHLDGLHFDYIRYPYAVPLPPDSTSPRLDFGYGETSLKRFEQETGLLRPKDGQNSASDEAWKTWRQRQLTAFLGQLRAQVKQRNPHLVLSAALLPSPARAVAALQDWGGWLEEGLLDLGVIMNYTKDADLARTLTRQALAARGKGRLFVGIGVYALLDQPDLLFEQITSAVSEGADGIVLFSHDNLLKKEGMFQTIRRMNFCRVC